MAKRANRRHRKFSVENGVKKIAFPTANPVTAQPAALELEMTDVSASKGDGGEVEVTNTAL